MTEKRKLYLKNYRENPTNKERHSESKSRYRQRLRIKCLLNYSNNDIKCNCCGEKENQFLSIDHIDGGGRKQREMDSAIGNNLYLWLIRNNFPSGFQVLCHNCNSAKGYYGICPHKK